jgi:membrane-bound lytic murein transglycosylase D
MLQMKEKCLFTIFWLITSCAFYSNNDIPKKITFTELNHSNEIYLTEDIKTAVDSIDIFYYYALKTIQREDTVGAKFYFERAFDIISNIDEDTKSTLMEWQAYDSLIHRISRDYENLFPQEVVDREAEEIREELINYEEDTFGDSLDSIITYLEQDTTLNTIPLELNNRVELALKYFQTRGREVLSIWLERTGKYEDMIKAILQQEGVPEDLFYLAMIESGLNPRITSYAQARGLWQFIKATGRAYGLRYDWWFDERCDPMLSTYAAAKHIKHLYERFDDWYLALAGYNCNPSKIERRAKQYNTNDFWQLRRLPRQTRNYIPTFIAATLIAKNPKKYGFYIDKIRPVEYDTIKISECVDLNIIAQCVDTTFEIIKELNPAVLRWCTPPGVKDFVLNIPKGLKQKFLENYQKVPEENKRSYVRHLIKRGETLSEIARKYSTTTDIIKEYNYIYKNLIHAGKYLIIPVAQNKVYYKSFNTVTYSSTKRRSYKKVSYVSGHKKIIHKVKTGDTLGEIAELYNTRASKIRSWNGLYYGQHIYPEQELIIWVAKSFKDIESAKTDEIKNDSYANATYYKVKWGDTLWDIARKYNTTVEEIKDWNKKKTNRIVPGETLLIKN